MRLVQGLPARVPDGRGHGAHEDRVPAPRPRQERAQRARPAGGNAAGLRAVGVALRSARERGPAPAGPFARAAGAGRVRFAPRRCRRSAPRPWLAEPAGARVQPGGREAVLFADTFNNWFEPGNLAAARRVMEAAGFEVVPARGADARPLCCGRTYLSAGMVDRAKAESRRMIDALDAVDRARRPGRRARALVPLFAQGRVPRDASRRFARGRRSRELAVTFESFVAGAVREGAKIAWREGAPPEILVHGHCHQKAFGSFDDTLAALRAIPGARVSAIESSCCGMAGSFGYERAHYDVSHGDGGGVAAAGGARRRSRRPSWSRRGRAAATRSTTAPRARPCIPPWRSRRRWRRERARPAAGRSSRRFAPRCGFEPLGQPDREPHARARRRWTAARCGWRSSRTGSPAGPSARRKSRSSCRSSRSPRARSPPVVLYLDSAGARISEGLDALGRVPQAVPRGAGGAHRRRADRGGARAQLLRRARACSRTSARGACSAPARSSRCPGRRSSRRRREPTRSTRCSAPSPRPPSAPRARAKASDANTVWTPGHGSRGMAAGRARARRRGPGTPSRPVTSRCDRASRRGSRARQPEARAAQGTREDSFRRATGPRSATASSPGRRCATGWRPRSSASSARAHVGAERAWRFAAGRLGLAIAGLRRRLEVLLDCESHAARLEDEKVVLTRVHRRHGCAPSRRWRRAEPTSSSPSSTGRAEACTWRSPRRRRTFPWSSEPTSRSCRARPSRAYWEPAATRWATFRSTARAGVADEELKLGLPP